MAAIKFDRINALEKGRTDCRLKVRVTRMWPTVSPDSGTTKGYNLILLDDDNAHVHSFSYTDVWKVIGKEVTEGGVYILQNFIIRDTVGNLKPVSTDVCLRFTNSTKFAPCADDLIIPQYKFEFFDLGDIFTEASKLKENENPEFAIDVIGVVENYEEVRKIPTKYGERDIVRFKISDGSNRHKIAIWGDLALAVNEEYNKFVDEENIIVILTSIKMSTFKSYVQLSSLPSSKVYFNLNDESVTEMRIRLEEEEYKLPTPVEYDLSAEMATLSPFHKVSLLQLNQNMRDKSEKKMYCTFNIVKVDAVKEWYFPACGKCQIEVLLVGKRFKCEKCSRNLPLADKRFRIKVNVEDSTFNSDVFLMDRVVKHLIGFNASKLYLDQTKDERAAGIIPASLHNMVGKEVTAVVQVRNLKEEENDYMIYAEDIYEFQTPANSNTESSPLPEYPSIDLTESLDNAATSKTPGSAKSINKKIKVEK